MKLPSITQAVQDARQSFIRFPLLIIDAVIGTIAMIAVIDREGSASPSFLYQVVAAAALGFPLLACLALTAEKKKWGTSVSFGAQAAGLMLVAAYSLTVPQNLVNGPTFHIIRLSLLAAALTLAAIVVPYFRAGSENGFWHYSKTIVIKLFIAFFYAAVLWMGLALALAALNNLFDIEIPGRRYGELWVALQGIFTPWFLLAGLPDNLDELDSMEDYPKTLRIFSQYILIPLILTYLVILYAYVGKILVAWDWPRGWVSGLILGFISTGLGTILLLHPIRGKTGSVWIDKASRWFFVVVIPLIIMLFLAVWRRVSEYGFTEGRYFAIAFGVWLCIVVAYFILSRRKSIRFIPASLALMALTVSFGPWSAFTVSEQSQVSRLQELLSRNYILSAGMVQSRHDPVPFEATKEISSIIAYLHEVHGLDGIQQWFRESLKSESETSGSPYRDPASVAGLMGIEYVRVWRNAGDGIIVLSADRQRPRDIGGYDRMLRAQHLDFGDTRPSTNEAVQYRLNPGSNSMTFFARTKEGAMDSIVVEFGPVVERLVKEYGSNSTDRVAPETMCASAFKEGMKIRVNLTSMRIQKRAGEVKPVFYDGDILYTIR